MRRGSPSLAGLMVLASVSLAAPLRANGRLPMAGQVVLGGAGSQTLLLRTTFGIALSHDGGASFRYVCEKAMHYGGAQDPPYALTPEGRILLVSSLGYVRGDAAGSHFDDTVPLRGARDLTVDPEGKTTWLLASTFQGEADAGAYTFVSRLFRAGVEGEGLEPDAGFWLPADQLYETVETLPGDPSRVLLSGAAHGNRQPDRASLSISEDGGEHFHRTTVPLEGRESSVYLAGIEGTGDAAQVFVRTAGGVQTPGRLLTATFGDLADRARRGEEAGLREVLRLSGPVLGFALDHAGSVYAGGDEGVFQARTDALRFEKRSSLRARCLAARPGELWACADEASGFLLGVSHDRGARFAAVLRLGQLQGLVPGAEIEAACGEEWQNLQREYMTKPMQRPEAEASWLFRIGYVVGFFALMFVAVALSKLRARKPKRSRTLL